MSVKVRVGSPPHPKNKYSPMKVTNRQPVKTNKNYILYVCGRVRHMSQSTEYLAIKVSLPSIEEALVLEVVDYICDLLHDDIYIQEDNG